MKPEIPDTAEGDRVIDCPICGDSHDEGRCPKARPKPSRKPRKKAHP